MQIIFMGVDPFQYGAEHASWPLASAIANSMELGFGALELEHMVFGWFSGRMTLKIPVVVIEEYVIEG